MKNHFDYIITGMGCAGLSLAVHMVKSGALNDKTMLLIDHDEKNKNDRTWCFWEQEEGFFETLVYRKWNQLEVSKDKECVHLNINPFSYKLIRGLDFYNYCLDILSKQSNCFFLNAKVDKIIPGDDKSSVISGDKTFTCEYVFNSILFNKPELRNNEYLLLQHFKGWLIKSDEPVFDTNVARLMDFRTPQEHGTAFVYTLPFANNEALVEYTVFSEKILPDHEYDLALQKYLEENLTLRSYNIIDKEFGVIPMTNHKFPAHDKNVINIGTAGGQTKGSTGYTFRFIQKQSAQIVQQLIKKEFPSGAADSQRHRFYDSVLLHILKNRSLEGSDIFMHLWKKNTPQKVFKFLDNETTLFEELLI
ncbi:MAG TPA: lycopene cyclase family protein, partial [Chitinophagaceae bacterium]